MADPRRRGDDVSGVPCGEETDMSVAAREQTVVEWLTLLDWEVEVREESGLFSGTATRKTDATTLRVEAQSASAESLAWRLVALATLELERPSARARVARAA
jgi:hypothetical protein